METGEEILDSINQNYRSLSQYEKRMADLLESHEERIRMLEREIAYLNGAAKR